MFSLTTLLTFLIVVTTTLSLEGEVKGKSCDDVKVLGDWCNPVVDREGDACDSDNDEYKAYCSYKVGTNSCAHCVSSKKKSTEFNLTFRKGTGLYKKCKLTTRVFGVVICYTKRASKNQYKRKREHIANVLWQYLDNDSDGKVDDRKVVRYMKKNKCTLLVPHNEESFTMKHFRKFKCVGMVTIEETTLNSCQVPRNRGASNTNRLTWPSAIDNNDNCSEESDACIEEIHHFLNMAAAAVYPDIWGDNSSSEVGSLILDLNGNCGWGSDWTNPGGINPKCKGTYAYDDETCKEDCRIIEGVYWSSVTWIGGLYTTQTIISAKNEWLMTVPDANMIALPGSYKNAITLEKGAPELYRLVSDTSSAGHLWLPSIVPDGKYVIIKG